MKVGVLALQGDVREHQQMLERLGVAVQLVRLPQHLELVDRLIIPGGESTTIGRLLTLYGMFEPIQARAGRGDLIVWGTCAGAILLAQRVADMKQGGQPTLGVMDISVRRNAFGSQLDSFETMLEMSVLGSEAFRGVFIRAPQIESVGAGVTVLARLDAGGIVAAQQGNLFVTTFHPELTDDDRIHRYFLELDGRTV
jgi:5'-phosphate synthase pdxT subunit